MLRFVSSSLAVASLLVIGSTASADPKLNSHGFAVWSRVVSLAHEFNPANPIFPGDPETTVSLWATVPVDGYRVEQVSLGNHTGTHMNAPCHFVDGAKCLDELPPEMFIRPLVVIDVRERVLENPDFQLTKQDIKDWEAINGRIPPGAIVTIFTGFGDQYFEPSYFDIAPGFAGLTAKWLMKPVCQGGRGAAGLASDTFGADATTDVDYSATYETLLAGGVNLENLTNLELVHPQGDTVVFLPARLQGSGFQTNVIALVR